MSGFVVAYVGPDGRELREDLDVVAGVAFELVPPVRSFPAYRGSATTRACGGRPRSAGMWASSRGWSGIT
ncbi:hypothetical protein [Polymorphospora rubra]|uniref:hypothetical protein n=1 Tax=Polymorphospora rubra TaxID=338584 RepID=UPI001BB3879D|nr:hypothetical protein [Polymorphospora rubra]